MDRKPLIGLAGVVVGVSFSELNDQIVQYALPDIAGGLGIGMDTASWFETVYLLGLILGAVCGPTLAVIFSARRFLLGAIALAASASLVTPLGGPLPILFASRVLQGLGEGLIISNLIAVALKALPPAVRLYGLIFYAMTATIIPSLATSLAALWIDVAGSWRLIFIQTTPLAALAAVLVWYGMPQEPPKLAKLKTYDWPGALLALTGFGALAILLEEGEQFDWFDSPTISVAALVGGIGLPAFILRELFAPDPLIGLNLLKRRNFVYPVVALILFIVISVSASAVPVDFLREVQGYRPLQSQTATAEVALAQLALLPATAWLLDHPWADARAVSAVGLLCIGAACLGGALVSSEWQWPQFIPIQALQAIGQPLVIMPLLMIATNVLKPEEGPPGAALVNAPRALAEAMGAGLISVVDRLRGALHRDRVLDSLGQNATLLTRLHRLPPAGRAATGALNQAVQQQIETLNTLDIYVLLAGLTLVLLVLALVLPERTLPPRLALAGS